MNDPQSDVDALGDHIQEERLQKIRREFARAFAGQSSVKHRLELLTKAALPHLPPEEIDLLSSIQTALNYTRCESNALLGYFIEQGMIDEARYYKIFADIIYKQVFILDRQLMDNFGIDPMKPEEGCTK